MNFLQGKLSRQLLSIIVIIFGIIFIFLGILLPRALLPVYERSVYNYLRQPLELIQSDLNDNIIKSEVGFLYIVDGNVLVSDNLYDIIKIKNVDQLIKKITESYGKFTYNNRRYYYYTIRTDQITKVALTNDTYITTMKQDVLNTILPVIFLSFGLIAIILIAWSGIIVKKIERLKSKVDHFDTDDFNHDIEFKTDDEIKSLALALEDMRISLKNQEEYRNQMYQNISHDFKTPLTVIKSYIEAVSDGVEDKDKAFQIIEEQTDKLEQKVHSLLYLNKLDYIKDFKGLTLKQIDIASLLKSSIDKFKFRRKDINFIVQVDKVTKFYGTEDLWETIIDNILNNFMRYADKEIKVTAKTNRLVFYNDGPNIDKDFLDSIFIPFRKGIKGEFGLGLSIVKKTVNLLGYEITIKNYKKKGVSFIVTKGIRK